MLKAAARQRLAAGQGELDLGLMRAAPGGPLPITSSRMGTCGMRWRMPMTCSGSTGRGRRG